MPAAEIDISVDLVAALVEAQHPDLAGPLRRVANGWDNVIFRLGEDLAVRLPRRAVAAALIENEQRWLAELAPRLPVPVPVPVRTGAPSDAFGWPWSITPWFVGDPLGRLALPDRRPYAATLGRFLACLHTPAAPDAPRNPVRGIPLAGRSEALSRQLETVPLDRRDELRRLWDRLVDTPEWPGPPRWLHGDPHPGNVLVHDGALAAVIDFGDLTAGDPATDLAVGWLAFDSSAREELRNQYAQDRSLDDDTWTRARGWALCLGVALIAHSDDEPVLAAVGHHALSEVLTGDR
ncbi:MAG TPA: aminoglycoside phosphotransferase family protein [Microlunatus sp.]|nr:aminoglycoside phosphotransferase family protein [Microlunatus sp.]